MATIGKDIMRAVMSLTGSPPPQLEGPEASGQTFKMGELLFYNAAGELAIIASDTPAAIYGVSREDASGVEATEKAVWLAHPETVFEANVVTTALANYVLLSTDIGRVMGILRDSTNHRVYLNAAIQGGSSAYVFVHRLARGSNVGDTNARVLFTFLPKFIQDLATS